MTALEFLNILCYRKDLDAKRKDDFEKWQRTH